MSPKLAGPLGNVVDSFQRFLETLGPLLPNLESFAKVITPSKTILELLADSIFPVLVPHIQKFAGFIADAADNALPALRGVLETVAPLLFVVSGVFEQIAPFVKAVADKVGDLVDTGLTTCRHSSKARCYLSSLTCPVGCQRR